MKRVIYFVISIIIIVIISLHCYNIFNLDNNNINHNTSKKIESFKGESSKIAFCFLTVDDVKHADIWEQYFKYGENKYSIYVHPKNIDKVTSFFKKFIIKFNVKTKWGDISLTDATNLMFIEALKDPANKKIILVSDSCIPIKSFDFIYDKVMSNDNSWFNYYKPNPENALLHYWRIAKLPNFLKKKSLVQEQWMILDRKHAIIIKDNYKKYRQYFNKNKLIIPDECIFITILNYLEPNFKNELQFQEHTRDQFKKHNYITFADWYDEGQLINSFHPQLYNKIEQNDIIQLKGKNSFFARKFSSTSDIKKYWNEIIN
jgi:hypothetical protein